MQPTPEHSVDSLRRGGKSGLRDPHRRSLMRMIFAVTALCLLVFAPFQFAAGHYYLGSAETLGFIALVIGIFRIGKSPHLRRWIIAYLIPTYVLMIVVMVVPSASRTSFVWAFMMPVLAYLLLGKSAGFRLAAPFMAGAGLYHIIQFGLPRTPAEAIDLFNPLTCGLVILVFIHLYETMRSEAEEQLVALAETDALTGLPNRSNFQATFGRTLNEAQRSGQSFALVVMDIDHFKNINDTLGHGAGDCALKALAESLNQRLRSTDFVGRLGGEEFGLILRDVNVDTARGLVEELRQRIAATDISYSGKIIRLTVTFGLAVWPSDGEGTTQLYQCADRRLYAGKHAGRNTVVADDGVLGSG